MVLVHKPLPESATHIPISFVCAPGIKLAEAKVLVNSLVLPFARNKDMCVFLFLRGWPLTAYAPCTLVAEGVG